MTYKNFPVYIGHANKKFTSQYGYHKDHMIYADRVNVSFNAGGAPNRRLGEDIDTDEQFRYSSDLTCDVSFDFLLYPGLNKGIGDTVYAFLNDSDDYNDDETYVRGNNSGLNYFPIKIGANFYNKCYIKDYSVEVSAFQPVKCRVNFKCFDPPANVDLKEDSRMAFSKYNDVMSGDAVINSYSCELSGLYNDIIYNDVIPRISYQKSYNVTPVYNLGSKKPSNFLINSIEAQTTFDCTGIANLFDNNGQKLENDILIKFKNEAGDGVLTRYQSGFNILIASGAKVNQQDYNVNGGDAVSARATIQEVIL